MERFQDWVRFLFDHPVHEPAWYWAADSEIEGWTADPSLTVGWMTHLFRQPSSLAPFSRDQVSQGLWFLLGDSSPGDFGRQLYEPEVDLGFRLECIRATPSFFVNYVAVHCARPKPVHCAKDADALETACFMWWDLWPDRTGLHESGPDSDAVDSAVLDALTAIAKLPSVACVESALHGLAHRHARQAQRTEEIVSSLLRQTSGWPVELVDYAEAAHRGMRL